MPALIGGFVRRGQQLIAFLKWSPVSIPRNRKETRLSAVGSSNEVCLEGSIKWRNLRSSQRWENILPSLRLNSS